MGRELIDIGNKYPNAGTKGSIFPKFEALLQVSGTTAHVAKTRKSQDRAPNFQTCQCVWEEFSIKSGLFTLLGLPCQPDKSVRNHTPATQSIDWCQDRLAPEASAKHKIYFKIHV